MLVLFTSLVLAQIQSVEISAPLESQPKWEGWGTSLCWMGKMFGDRDDLADTFFTVNQVSMLGQMIPGLGINIVRYNAGACSWNEIDGRKMVVSKTIQPFRQMEGFWLDPKMRDPNSSGWNWNLDQNQRTMVKKAIRRGANHIELFSNSPMWWMCANDNPSGAANSEMDNLREDQFANFAHYLTAVAQKAKKDWGYSFTTIEPFNEPMSKWWGANGKQEGCHFSHEAQKKLLPLLRQALDNAGLKELKIASSDETSMSDAINTWKSFGPDTKSLVDQVNVHGYEGVNSPRSTLRKVLGSTKLWLSEHGENDRTGLAMAKSMALDFYHLAPRAWCYWQPLDNTGWGMIEAEVPNAKLISVNPKYFVMAQFSRHIREGSLICKSSGESVVSAYDPPRKVLSVVIVNRGAEKEFDLNLKGFTSPMAAKGAWLTSPKADARYAVVPVPGDIHSIKVPSESVLTIEFQGVAKEKPFLR
jgi:galactan endo-1,6-beta-galactosidase